MIIIDTNVIIDIERGKSSLTRIFQQFPDERFGISAISLMELYAGLGHSKEKKGEAFYQKQKQIIDIILSDFEVLEISIPILKQAGLKRGELLAQGTIIDNEDIIIGSTAEILEIPQIITHNQKHFQYFNLQQIHY